MLRAGLERVLLIGDRQQQVASALAQALPAAQVTSVASVFDGIAELSANTYTAVMAAVEPIERRPEAAVKTLRGLAGEARLLLFGHPTLEPLSRKMLDFGCDDYLITPVGGNELQRMFDTPPLRLAPPVRSAPEAARAPETTAAPPPPSATLLAGMPLGTVLLDALLQNPQGAAEAAVKQIGGRLEPTMQLRYLAADTPLPALPADFVALSNAVRVEQRNVATVQLIMPQDQDESAARHFLVELSQVLAKLRSLEDRHGRLQKLAITDDLTGVYNGRYFNHFLNRIMERGRIMRFPVTLLLFDIDNFKRYNDQYGHGVGDEILKQTAALMRRCCRDHDLVARIGGDEFAAVFWEKEGPRQSRDPKAPAGPSRPPQTPLQILERFRKLIATENFSGLGPGGQGVLTISGGLAVYPFDAQTPAALIEAADKALMFGAKQSGKNSIFLVGGRGDMSDPQPIERPELT